MASFTDEEVERILRGRREARRIPFPGAKSIEIGIRILTDRELDDCRLEAVSYCKRLKVDLDADPEMLEREIERQVIWRSTCDASTIGEADPRPFFPSDRDVRELDGATIRALLDSYLELQNAVRTTIDLDEDGVRELVDALGKGGELEASLNAYGRDTLRALCLSLASALRKT